MENKKSQFRLDVSEDFKATVDAHFASHGMSRTVGAVRLFTWFNSSDRLIQQFALGTLQPESRAAALRKLITALGLEDGQVGVGASPEEMADRLADVIQVAVKTAVENALKPKRKRG